jgi:hypothetical protein
MVDSASVALPNQGIYDEVYAGHGLNATTGLIIVVQQPLDPCTALNSASNETQSTTGQTAVTYAVPSTFGTASIQSLSTVSSASDVPTVNIVGSSGQSVSFDPSTNTFSAPGFAVSTAQLTP